MPRHTRNLRRCQRPSEYFFAPELGPKDRLEGFDGLRENPPVQAASGIFTGLNDAVKSFILMSYEHRV